MDWKYDKERIYSIDNHGELMAEVTYKFTGENEIDINHVYVNPTLRGKGTANEAMLIVVEFLRKSSLRAIATCSYANTWLNKNSRLCKDVKSDKNGHVANACNIHGKH